MDYLGRLWRLTKRRGVQNIVYFDESGFKSTATASTDGRDVERKSTHPCPENGRNART